MMNIKEYIMNNAVDSEASRRYGKPASSITVDVEEVVDDQEHCIVCGSLYLEVREIEDKTEQEIKDLITYRASKCAYGPDIIPDNVRVYLCIGDKRYLLADEYRPDLYY